VTKKKKKKPVDDVSVLKRQLDKLSFDYAPHKESKLFDNTQFYLIEDADGITLKTYSADKLLSDLGFEHFRETATFVHYIHDANIFRRKHHIFIARAKLGDTIMESYLTDDDIGCSKRFPCALKYNELMAAMKKIEERGWDKR